VLGQFSNQFLANIIGQSVSRSALLRQHGVPVSVTILATWAERLLAFLLLFMLAILGAALFFSDYMLDLVDNGTYHISITLRWGVALGAAFAIAARRLRIWLRGAWTKQRIVTATAVTAAAMNEATLRWRVITLGY